MKRYDSYKPSGIEWIGEIPSHWIVNRLKFEIGLHGRIGWNGLRSDEFQVVSHAYLVTGQDFEGSDIPWDKCYQIDKQRYEEDPFIQLTEGDILVTKDGSIGKVAMVRNLDKPACLNSGIFVLKQKHNVFNQLYLYWLLNSDVFKGFISYHQSGSTILHLYQNVFDNMPTLIPPMEEQIIMSNYLEKKCGEIDMSIAKQQRRIELLEELKHSVIVESFNIDARKLKLRFIFEFRNGYTPSKANPEFWEDGTIPWFRMEDIRTKGRILEDAIQHITPEAVKAAGLFEAGSFIMATTATIGEHALLIADSLANQRFTNLKIRKSLSSALDTMYVFYFLYVIDDWCKSTVNTTCFSQVDMDEFRNQTMPIPPIEEQKEIVQRLDKRCSEIDSMIEREKKKIELMQELKQSIITEVVTGKRKVV